MTSKKILLVLLTICLGWNQAFGEMLFYRSDSTDNVVHQFHSSEQGMGIPVPEEGIWATLTVADPENACADVEPAPAYDLGQYQSFSLISNSLDPFNCSVGEKTQNLRLAGYDGAVMYFTDDLKSGDGKFEKFASSALYNYTIVFLTPENAQLIKTKYNTANGYVARILNKPLADKKYFASWKIWAIGIAGCVLALLVLYSCKRYLDAQKGSKFF